MTSEQHARTTYHEILKSWKRFREAERDYDAVTALYENEVRSEFGVPHGQELGLAQRMLARQRAEKDPQQVAAAGVCRYFLERTQAAAAVYQVEVDYGQRFDGVQRG